ACERTPNVPIARLTHARVARAKSLQLGLSDLDGALRAEEYGAGPRHLAVALRHARIDVGRARIGIEHAFALVRQCGRDDAVRADQLDARDRGGTDSVHVE